MYFTNGDHQAFESLMRGKPGDHYDSGEDGPFPECRSCRCHRPHRKDRYCKYAECPYTPGRVTAIDKGNPLGKGGEAFPLSFHSKTLIKGGKMPSKTRKSKKRAVCLIALFLVFSTMFSAAAFAYYQNPAASVLFHSSKQISGGYPRIIVFGRDPNTGSASNKMIANMEGLTGHSLSIDGVFRPVYCLNPNLPADSNYVEGPSYKANRWARITSDQQDLILRALYCGYPNTVDHAVPDATGSNAMTSAQAQQLALQAMIFNIRCNFVVKSGAGIAASTAYNNTDSFDARVTEDCSNFHAAYANLFARMNSFIPAVGVPSFSTLSTETASSGKTIQLNYDSASGKYIAAVTDSNGVLEHYNFASMNGSGITYSARGNTLTITATPEAAASLSSATRKGYVRSDIPDVRLTVDDVSFYVKSGTGTDNYQTMVEYVSSSSSESYKSVYLVLQAEAKGYIHLVKRSSDSSITGENSSFSLAGAVYSIYAAHADAEAKHNPVGTITTDENGEGTSASLASATYYVRETSPPPGYELSDQIHTASVPGGSTVTINAEDTPIRGHLKIVKLDAYEDTPLSGAGFRLFDSGGHLIDEGYTDANGELIFENLLYGSYLYQEFCPPKGYKLDDAVYPFSITEHGVTITQERDNLRRPGTLEVKKQDQNGKPLAGASFLLEYSTDNGASWAAVFSRDGDNIQTGGCTSPGLSDGQLTTDGSGVVTFSGLRADSSILYRLTETQAPVGHSLLGSPLYVGTLPVEISGEAADSETVDGVTYCYTLYVTATDDPLFRIPETGGAGFAWLPLFMGFMTMSYITIKRKDESES